MIIVIDTFSGLCNQFYDINCSVNFCLINNFKFTFRYCSFRNKDLISWYNKNFNELFNVTLFEKYKNLYIDFNTLYLTDNNTYNLEGEIACKIFTDNYLNEIKQITKEYIVLKQFWIIYKSNKIIENIYLSIFPSIKLMCLYHKIKNNLLKNNEKYNFIHYRYEFDFTNYFEINIESLESIIFKINKKFKNPDLTIYIASSNIKNIINCIKLDSNLKIISKNEDELKDYNFEELAFIDFMFGLSSNEVYGHSKSSFSNMLNNFQGTHNYYA
jgi:hypothetical protein